MPIPTIEEARRMQLEIAEKVITNDAFPLPIRFIAGVDISTIPFDKEERLFCAAVLFSFPDMTLQEIVTHVDICSFPYIPGFLGFREAPALVKTLQKLKCVPDIIMVDGHGVSHPRRAGIASHIGYLLDIPTIGVAKSILVGKAESPLSELPLSQVSLMRKNEEIAIMLRSKKRCNPLIISEGHKVSRHTAVNIVKQCLRGYRLPEPTRQAHIASNALRKKEIQL